MSGAGRKGRRRSASVDVNRRGQDEPEEKEGETIVDLGRRATSDVGGVKEKEKAPSMPMDPPTIKKAASKGYSSDTAMVRNDSTKRQVPAPVVQHAYISSTSTSAPSRRASIKSSTSTPSKSPGISSTSGIPATVLQAGGENPSGTLVPYPGWEFVEAYIVW
jgi:hypothetical protein